MDNRRIIVIISATVVFLVLVLGINYLIRFDRRPTLKANFVARLNGNLTSVDGKIYLENNKTLYLVNEHNLELAYKFAGDSQIIINQQGDFVSEKRPNVTTIYSLNNFTKIKQLPARFFDWIDASSYLFTNLPRQNEATDAGDLIETAYSGTIESNQTQQLFTGQLITYLMLSDPKYLDLGQRKNNSFETVGISYFDRSSKQLKEVGSLLNFGLARYQPLNYSLVQINTEKPSPIQVLKNDKLSELKIVAPLASTVGINNKEVGYIGLDKDNTTDEFSVVDIENNNTRSVAKINMHFNGITSVVIGNNKIYLNSADGIYWFDISELLK